MTEICSLLEWDTSFFGFRIARVNANTLIAEQAALIDSWCFQNRIRCLYFLARADDASTIRLAETQGYRLVDIRLTLEKARPSKPEDRPRFANSRPATPQDLEPMKQIAGKVFRDTRFYFDENFPRASCDRLYETWIERSYLGGAGAVVVVPKAGDLMGFATCHLEEQHGRIGLVGVAAEMQGRGVGRILLSETLEWFWGAGAACVSVVTQARNVAAQRLYQQSGFLTTSVNLWYHKWFS